MKKAFTLAEVLIVIGVIGVVAALTIPVLMTNIKAAQFRSKIKKEVSVLNQAVRLNKANTGVDFSNVCGYAATATCSTDDNIINIFKNNIKEGASKRTANIYYKTCSSENEDDESYCINSVGNDDYVMNIDLNGIYVHLDGAHFAIPAMIDIGDCHADKSFTNFRTYDGGNANWGLEECVGWIDINGPEGPNKEVNCTTGTYSTDLTEPCTVSNKDVTDVYPVLFIDSTVMPATNAAKAVLGGK